MDFSSCPLEAEFGARGLYWAGAFHLLLVLWVVFVSESLCDVACVTVIEEARIETS